MVSRDQLRVQGLRAYEWGRLRTAARVAFVLVPVALLCLLENRGRAECVCVAAVGWRSSRQAFKQVAFRSWRGSSSTGLALNVV
jgi:hypothetical protein